MYAAHPFLCKKYPGETHIPQFGKTLFEYLFLRLNRGKPRIIIDL